MNTRGYSASSAKGPYHWVNTPSQMRESKTHKRRLKETKPRAPQIDATLGSAENKEPDTVEALQEQ